MITQVPLKSLTGRVPILAHEVAFNWWNIQGVGIDGDLLLEEAARRAEECIKAGYTSGQLCYEDGLASATGWWEIK